LENTAKDLAVAVLGAAVALAGLLLVFVGFLFSQADGFPPATTDDATIRNYKRAGRIGLIPFVGCLALAWLAGLWLREPSQQLMTLVWWGFGVVLILTAVYGTTVFMRQLS